MQKALGQRQAWQLAEKQCFLLEPQEGNEVRAAGGEVRERQDQDRKGIGRSLAFTCYLAQ